MYSRALKDSKVERRGEGARVGGRTRRTDRGVKACAHHLNGDLAGHARDVELGEGLPFGLSFTHGNRRRDLHPLVGSDGEAAVFKPVASDNRDVLARVLSLLLRGELV